jgi:hypothetical protein
MDGFAEEYRPLPALRCASAAHRSAATRPLCFVHGRGTVVVTAFRRDGGGA